GARNEGGVAVPARFAVARVDGGVARAGPGARAAVVPGSIFRLAHTAAGGDETHGAQREARKNVEATFHETPFRKRHTIKWKLRTPPITKIDKSCRPAT